MQRELFGSFGRGARLGALICSVALLLAVIGSVELSASDHGSSPDQASMATRSADTADDAADDDATRSLRRTKLADHEIDLALLKAVRAQRQEIQDFLFELSTTAPSVDLDPNGVPIEPLILDAPPEVVPTPVRRAVLVTGEALRAALRPVFGAQTETAYAVVMCESAGNAAAHTGNGYYGMWQFDLATWASVGGTGYPSDASVAEQIQRAKMLHAARGWQPWECHPASHGGLAPTPAATATPEATRTPTVTVTPTATATPNVTQTPVATTTPVDDPFGGNN